VELESKGITANDSNAVNWLQINNLFPRECPLWQKVDDLA